MKKYTIPTGYLFTDEYSKGTLETLSIGDYGKAHNVKADFLGYSKEINGVPNTYCMPLSEKWVVTVSTQYGCLMRCNFCDVPNVKWGGNVPFEDLKKQLYSAIKLFPGTKYTERLNLHFARMGDPIFNNDVFEFSEFLYKSKGGRLKDDTGLSIEVIHPVLTTSSPKALKDLGQRIKRWTDIKNKLYNGQAGLQLSINSTDDKQRETMFNGMACSLEEISDICRSLDRPIGRKYCLNFAYSTDYIIDAERVRKLFDPEYFMCKITPIHNNTACMENGIKTIGGYDTYLPYLKPEVSLKAAGFDVLVFVPSIDEEDGLVTCGNAITGGSKLKTDSSLIKIHGLA